jgi:ribosomal protein S8
MNGSDHKVVCTEKTPNKLKNGLKSDRSTRIETISHHKKHINQIQKHHGFTGQRGVTRKSKRQKKVAVRPHPALTETKIVAKKLHHA